MFRVLHPGTQARSLRAQTLARCSLVCAVCLPAIQGQYALKQPRMVYGSQQPWCLHTHSLHASRLKAMLIQVLTMHHAKHRPCSRALSAVVSLPLLCHAPAGGACGGLECGAGGGRRGAWLPRDRHQALCALCGLCAQRHSTRLGQGVPTAADCAAASAVPEAWQEAECLRCCLCVHLPQTWEECGREGDCAGHEVTGARGSPSSACATGTGRGRVPGPFAPTCPVSRDHTQPQPPTRLHTHLPQAEAEDEPLAIAAVTFEPGAREALGACWARRRQRSLYDSAQAFEELVVQVSCPC